MKTRLEVLLSIMLLFGAGCRNRHAELEKAREDSEAKARAEAARNEQDKLSRTYQNPDYFKKNPAASGNTDATKSK